MNFKKYLTIENILLIIMSSVILNDVLNNIDQEEIMKLINNMELLNSTLQHSKYNMIAYDELSNYFLYI